MKNKIIICVAMMAVGMVAVSCSKDNEELIIGNWRIQSFEGDNPIAIKDGSRDNQSNIEYVDNFVRVFYFDGTGLVYNIENGNNDTTGYFCYSIDNDSLHITYDNGIGLSEKIETLNKRKLRLSMRMETTDVDGNFVGYANTYSNYKRI